jgi:hypothetical protein
MSLIANEPKPELLPPELRDANVRYRLEGADGTSRDLLLRGGRVSVPTEAGTPDAVLLNVPPDAMSLVDGRVNLLTAVMRGDIQIRGSLAAAALLYTYGRYAGAAEKSA